jgi:hypothetical protein
VRVEDSEKGLAGRGNDQKGEKLVSNVGCASGLEEQDRTRGRKKVEGIEGEEDSELTAKVAESTTPTLRSEHP